MLNKTMSLREMVDFMPSETNMLSLPLDVILYFKVSIISMVKEDNYGFLNHLFTDSEVTNYIKDIPSTIIYDFDGTSTNQERFVTILEMYGLKNYEETVLYLQEILNKYSHDAEVIIDIFTHDDKCYRLDNLNGIVELNNLKGE